jgi:mannosyltransferase OCH1-like enzyme
MALPLSRTAKILGFLIALLLFRILFHTSVYLVQIQDDPNWKKYLIPWNHTGEGLPSRIPKIIHQVWKNETIPQKWNVPRRSCLVLNANYENYLWTDDAARSFLELHYPDFLPVFDSYPYDIQRADAIRYFVLYHFGGVYIDMDVSCRKSLDPLLTYNLIVAKTKPVGYSNDVMFAEPKHPFFRQIIDNIPHWNNYYGTKYPTVMVSTGSLFFTHQFNQFQSKEVNSTGIISSKLYGGGELSYFGHKKGRGNSWHGADTQFVFFLYKNMDSIVVLSVSIVITIAVFCCRRIRDSDRSKKA